MSCTDSLSILRLDIDDALDKNKQVMAVFLDVSNAFGNVTVNILLEKLVKVGCSTRMLHFVTHMTHSRRVCTQANMNETSSSYTGMLQGEVRSPLLYTL